MRKTIPDNVSITVTIVSLVSVVGTETFKLSSPIFSQIKVTGR